MNVIFFYDIIFRAFDIAPVSYTHLDVYKRQTLKGSNAYNVENEKTLQKLLEKMNG